MHFELGLLPSGHIHCYAANLTHADANESVIDEERLTKIQEAFTRHVGQGLFTLAADKNVIGLPPSLRYWHHFASCYLNVRCGLVEENVALQQGDLWNEYSVPAVASLDIELAQQLLQSAPPMPGLEYLSIAVLQETWQLLDDWVRELIHAKGSIATILNEAAPQWHPVGRVCFHLAENKNDPQYPFAFMATYAPEKARHVRYQPLHQALKEYAAAKDKPTLIRLLTPIYRAAESSSLIKDLVEQGDIYHPLAWTPKEAHQFLCEVPLYEESGLVARLPNWWQKQQSRPQVTVRIGDTVRKRFGQDALLNFKVQLTLDGETFSDEELAALQNSEEGLVFLKGKWIEVDQKRLDEALTHWQKVEQSVSNGELSFAEGMRLLAGTSYDLKQIDHEDDIRKWSTVEPGAWLSDLLANLRSPDTNLIKQLDQELKAQLRPYQEQGVNWLWLLSQLGLGACLADDMGLGKTIQIIALLLLLKQNPPEAKTHLPSLLVLPASLLANWEAELKRFAPSLRSCFIHGSHISTKEMDAIEQQPEKSLAAYDLVLTTYGTLMRRVWLKQQQWRLLILDEAQAIKNVTSRQTKAVKQLQGEARIALTGTPVENSLSDLWSLFDFINPGLLGNSQRFKTFVKSLQERTQDQYAPLRRLTQPYILRRLKTDKSIIADLPEKSEIAVWCGLSKIQASLYQRAVNNLAHNLENAESIQRRGLVLAALQHFKQICNHPAQFTGDRDYTPNKSGKFQRLIQLCAEIASRQEKALIFTQFREITAHLADFLAQCFGQPGLILHGGTPISKRRKLVETFQDESGPPFFVISLKAGGTGLNLTEASHVIHFDRWWNPAVENQATDRAFRIGQKKNVLVHKCICRGTIEEKIDTLIRDKTALASDLLQDNKEITLTEMSNEALLNLISLDIEKTEI